MRVIVLILATIAAMAGTSLAQEDVAHVKYRQKVMKSIGAGMGAISDILKNGLPLTDNIGVHAQSLELAGSLIESAFKAPVSAGHTEALLAIWMDWAGYLEATRGITMLPQNPRSGDAL